MAFIVGLAAIALLIKSFGSATLQAERDADTMKSLRQAKQALIAWSVAHPNWPGVMPFPDRNGDGDYDGESDCVTSGLAINHLIGKLPLLGESPCISPQDGLGVEPYDSSGEKLWYAVSMNLIRTNGSAATPVINPGIIDNPTNPWMVVRDAAGVIVSDRVAVVILAPGSPISGQDRSSTAPSIAQFLDQITINGTIYSNSDYDSNDEDFIMGNILTNSFNDKLAYITIDELMAALERRIGAEVRAQLINYKNARDAETPLVANDGYYPYAAQLGTTQNFSGEQDISGTNGLTGGFLPVNYQSCSYSRASGGSDTSSLTCLQPVFDSEASGIERVRFTSSLTSFGGHTGSCISSSTNCDCTGNGTCSTTVFGITILFVSCTASSCSATSWPGFGALGSYQTRGGKFTSRSGGCVHTTFPTKDPATGCHNNSVGGTGNNGNATMTCSTSNGSFASSADARFDTFLPAWFTANNWQEYVYYHFTRPAVSTMTVGAKNAETVVVTVGRAIDSAPFPSKGSAQIRPSCNALDNYLDSVENADGDTVYDATSTPRSANYNDQKFVVSP